MGKLASTIYPKHVVPYSDRDVQGRGSVQNRTVALATSGQKYNSISLFTYHVSLLTIVEDKKGTMLNYGRLE